MKYKEYSAVIDYDEEQRMFHGRVIGIKDVVNFYGHTRKELEKEFKNSINDYLEFKSSQRTSSRTWSASSLVSKRKGSSTIDICGMLPPSAMVRPLTEESIKGAGSGKPPVITPVVGATITIKPLEGCTPQTVVIASADDDKNVIAKTITSIKRLHFLMTNFPSSYWVGSISHSCAKLPAPFFRQQLQIHATTGGAPSP